MGIFRVITTLVVFAASCLAQSVTYHSGAILVDGARVYFIWAGSWTEADKTTYRNFTVSLNNSSYLAGMTGFYDLSGRHILNASQVLGETTPVIPYPQPLFGNQVVTIIEKAIADNGWPCDQTAIYAFMSGPGAAVQGAPGWHNSLPCGVLDGTPTPTSKPVAFLVSGPVVGVYSHELVEAMSDPIIPGSTGELLGWFNDSSQLEIADLCGTYSYYTLSTGTFFAANYVKASGGCTGASNVNPPPPPPPSPCPPGTKRRGKNGCK